MTELNLLVFGCGVSFTALAGAYVYLRECFVAADEKPLERELPVREMEQPKFRDVA